MRQLWIVSFAALVGVACAADVFAQAGLIDLSATQAIGEELEGGATRAAAAAAEGQSPPAEAPVAEEEEGARAVAPAPSEGDSFEKDKWDDEHSIARLRTPAGSPIKLALAAAMLLIWVGTSDWVNRDTQKYELNPGQWNAIVFFPGLAAGLFFFLPYLAALPMALLAWLVPFVLYVRHHNASVEQHQKVFTRDWFNHEIAAAAGKLGMKVSTEKQADYEKGPPVQLAAQGSDEEGKNNANLMIARQSPGYVLVKELIADLADRRVDRVMLDYTREAVAIRHQIDGVWHNAEPRDRESGDVILAVMKQLANLNPVERRKAQSGQFGAEYKGIKYTCPIESQGTQTGERAIVACRNLKQQKMKTFAELGMRDKIAEPWAEAFAGSSGLLLVASLPEGGLTTLTNVSLMETDRLMREFVAVEEATQREAEIENIGPFLYSKSAEETPLTILPKILRKYPDAYVVRDFNDPESAKAYLAQAKEGKLMVTTIHAREAAEAPMRLAQKFNVQAEVAQTLVAVICTRLIRTLCDGCKVGFEPAPELLAKLGIPAGKLELLYREPTAEEIKKPCTKCGGSFFIGRTGLFELIVVDDAFRDALTKGAQPDMLRKVARQGGMRTLQEEGILLLAKGATSLAELQRVLKQ